MKYSDCDSENLIVMDKIPAYKLFCFHQSLALNIYYLAPLLHLWSQCWSLILLLSSAELSLSQCITLAAPAHNV